MANELDQYLNNSGGPSLPAASPSSSSLDSYLKGGGGATSDASSSPINGQTDQSPKFDYQDPNKTWYERGWSWLQTPLTESLFGLPETRPGAGGFERGIERVASGLTSPLSVGLTAATLGGGGLIESAGTTALKESGEFAASEIPQIMKASEAAIQATKDLKPIEPFINDALRAKGGDGLVDLVNKAKSELGPIDLSDKFGEEEVQKNLAKAGFSEDEIKDLSSASKTIQKANQDFSPVEDAVKATGVDPALWKRAQATLYNNGLTEQDLLGGNAVERGAFQILRKAVPDLPIATSVRAAKTANVLLNTGFTLQQLEVASQMSPRFLDALKEGDYDSAKEYGTEMLAGAGLGILGTSHALHSAGELFKPLLETDKFRPNDEWLSIDRANKEREANHVVAEQTAVNLDQQARKLLGHEAPRPVLGDTPEVKSQKELELATVLHQVVTGGDKNKAAGWYNALSEAAGKEDRLPISNGDFTKDVIESPNFKKWFGNSEVTDQNGQPKIVYHGSNRAGFENFRKDVLDPNSLYGKGVYTTENPEIASDYAQTRNVRGSYSSEDLAKYFTPGNIVKGYGGYDKVIAFHPADPTAPYPRNTWNVDVQGVDPKTGEAKPYERIRNHATSPKVSDVSKALGTDSQAVYPMRASIQKPFDMDSNISEEEAKNIFSERNKTGWIDDLYKKNSKVDGSLLYSEATKRFGLGDYLGEGHGGIKQEGNDLDEGSAQENVNTILRKAGYDGIKHTGGTVTGGANHQVWIAFDPEQLRPAYDSHGVDPKSPQNGQLREQISSNKFKDQSKSYQDTVLNSLKKVAEGNLSDKEKSAADFLRDEQARNFQIGSSNDLLHHQIEDYMTRVYEDTNPEGKVILSNAKQGRFSTNVNMARQRVYDSHIVALLKSPKKIFMDPAQITAQGRASLIKAAANRQLIDTLRDKFTRGSDGRPAVVLSGQGQVITGQNGEDPKIFIDPNRVRKINISDNVVQQLTKSGDLQRFLDEGTIRDITPYVHPQNISAAISRLEEQSIGQNAKYDEVGNNKLRTQIMYLKSMLANKDYSGLKEFNDGLEKSYAWDPQDYIKLDNGALKGWNFTTNSSDGAPIFVRSDIRIHPEFAEYLQNRLGLSPSAIASNPVGKALLGAGTKLKQTLLSLSPFHMAQEALRAIMVGVNPFHITGPDILTGEKIDPSDPYSPTILKKAVEQGATLGTDYKSLQEHSEGLSAGGGLLRSIPGVGKTLANSLDWYQDFLFKRYIPALKSRSIELMFHEYQRLHPDWSVDRVAKAAGLHANDTFGGIGWKAMGRSATTQDWGRLMLLAPDWLESEMRSGARLFNKDEGGLGRAQVAKMALGLWGAARVLNLAVTHNAHYEAPFGLAVKNKEGKETVFGIRTLPTDLLHAASDPVGFLKGRLSPVVRTGTELASGRDQYGRKLGPEDLWADVFRNMAPIPVQSVGQAISGSGPNVGNIGQTWKSVGGTAQTYSTPAQKMAADLASAHSEDGPIDPAQMERHRRVMEMEDSVRSGQMSWPDLMKLTYSTDQLKESELKKIETNLKATHKMSSDMAVLYTRASRLPAKEYLDLLSVSNPAEKSALFPLTIQVQKRYLTKAKKEETPEERAKDPVFQKLLNMAPQVPNQ